MGLETLENMENGYKSTHRRWEHRSWGPWVSRCESITVKLVTFTHFLNFCCFLAECNLARCPNNALYRRKENVGFVPGYDDVYVKIPQSRCLMTLMAEHSPYQQHHLIHHLLESPRGQKSLFGLGQYTTWCSLTHSQTHWWGAGLSGLGAALMPHMGMYHSAIDSGQAQLVCFCEFWFFYFWQIFEVQIINLGQQRCPRIKCRL